MIMEYAYCFAGVPVTVTCPADQIYESHGVLEPFVAKPCGKGHKIDIQITDHLDAPVGKCVYMDSSVRVYLEGNTQVRSAARSAVNIFSPPLERLFMMPMEFLP